MNIKQSFGRSQLAELGFYLIQFFNLLIYGSFLFVYQRYVELPTNGHWMIVGSAIFTIFILGTIGRMIWKYITVRAIRYWITDERLETSVGVFEISKGQIELHRMRDFQVKRTFLQRLLGIGDVTIISIDKTTPTLVMRDIPKPIELTEFLRTRTPKKSGEIDMGAGFGDTDGDGFEFDDGEFGG